MNAGSSWFKETLLSKFKWLMIFPWHRECFNLHNYTCINYALTGSPSWVHPKVSLRERCRMWQESLWVCKCEGQEQRAKSLALPTVRNPTYCNTLSKHWLFSEMWNSQCHRHRLQSPLFRRFEILQLEHQHQLVLPAATITMSASCVWILSCSFGVYLWVMVTVASPETEEKNNELSDVKYYKKHSIYPQAQITYFGTLTTEQMIRFVLGCDF